MGEKLIVVEILKQCQREILEFPVEIRGDIADAAARLDEGQRLSMPLSRPMPGIGHGTHELRLRDRAGIYRVIYYLAGAGMIYFLRAFKKKSWETLWQDIEIAKKRLKEAVS